MADVATRSMNTADILRHRITEIYVTDGTDKKWRIDSLRQKLAVTRFENPPNLDAEPLVDGSEIKEITSTNHAVEFLVDEVNEADINTINGSTITDIGFVTSTGGANGTGREVELQDCDYIHAYVSGSKTIVVGEKRASGKNHGFTISDNAA